MKYLGHGNDMNEYNSSLTSRKLAQISEVMADGFHFVQLRALVETWQKQADAGDVQSQEMMKVIDTFHRLCQVVKGDN
jgi:hypothetical protein